jgi:uncharacterized protein with ParB-like and HNH nuclease domain
MKITPATLTLNNLFSGANEQFVIPPYQRRYSWRERQIYDLIDDINLIEGGIYIYWELSSVLPFRILQE